MSGAADASSRTYFRCSVLVLVLGGFLFVVAFLICRALDAPVLVATLAFVTITYGSIIASTVVPLWMFLRDHQLGAEISGDEALTAGAHDAPRLVSLGFEILPPRFFDAPRLGFANFARRDAGVVLAYWREMRLGHGGVVDAPVLITRLAAPNSKLMTLAKSDLWPTRSEFMVIVDDGDWPALLEAHDRSIEFLRDQGVEVQPFERDEIGPWWAEENRASLPSACLLSWQLFKSHRKRLRVRFAELSRPLEDQPDITSRLAEYHQLAAAR